MAIAELEWGALARRMAQIDTLFGCRTTSLEDLDDLQDAVLLRLELQLAATLQLKRMAPRGAGAPVASRVAFPLRGPTVPPKPTCREPLPANSRYDARLSC